MKNDYRRNSFWIFKKDGVSTYFICKRGNKVEVDKTVYLCCLYSYRKIRKIQQLDHDYVDLYEDMDIFSKGEEDPLQELMKQKLQRLISEALSYLDPQEQTLIMDIFYKDKTQKQISEELHMPEYTVSRMKTRILKKLKKIIKNLQDAEIIESFHK